MFVSAFLAATILPLSSEVVLSSLLLTDLSVYLLVAVASFGNVLGSCVNYFLGYWGCNKINQKWLGVSEEKMRHHELRFKRWGTTSLLLAWVPIIGDPITIVAGVLKVNFIWFLFLVSIGKFSRYVVLAYSILYAT